MNARPVVLCASAMVAVATLTGCQKPTPGVTLVSGGHTVRTESSVYCRDGQTVAKMDCSTHPARGQVLRVKQGAQVGVDVDKTLRDHGWLLIDADRKQRSNVQDTHYLTLDANFTGRPTPGIINLEVRSLDHASDNATVTGLWRFQLVQK